MTPTQPVFIAGQFHGRLPEEPVEPLTVTVLVLDTGTDCAAFIVCDLVCVFLELELRVRAGIATAIPELNNYFDAHP